MEEPKSKRRHKLRIEERQKGLLHQYLQWRRPGESPENTRKRYFQWFSKMGTRHQELPQPYNRAFWQQWEAPDDAPTWAHRFEARLWCRLIPFEWPISQYAAIRQRVDALLDEDERREGLREQSHHWRRSGESLEQTIERYAQWLATMEARYVDLPRPASPGCWQQWETPNDAPFWAHQFEARLWNELNPVHWPLDAVDDISWRLTAILDDRRKV